MTAERSVPRAVIADASAWGRAQRLQQSSSPLPMGMIIASTSRSLSAVSSMGCRVSRD